MDIRDISRIITEDINENNGLIRESPDNLDSEDEWDVGDTIRIHNSSSITNAGFKIEPTLERIAVLKNFDDLFEESDYNCSNDYDGVDSFENGFALGRESNGKDVYMFLNNDSPRIALFFIGTSEEVKRRIMALPG